jgi:hypothetical protein
MPLSLLNHSELALFAQRTRIPTSARSIGFCAIWVCISRVRVRDTITVEGWVSGQVVRPGVTRRVNHLESGAHAEY